MEYPVNNGPADDAEITLEERSHGRYAGALLVPDAGFRWSYERPMWAEDDALGPWLMWVDPDGDATVYPPMRRRAIVADFDTLAAGRQELPTLLRFADRYGPLTEVGETRQRWLDELRQWRRLRDLWKLARTGQRGLIAARVKWQPLTSPAATIPSPGAITVDGKLVAWADNPQGVAAYLGRDPVRVAYYHVIHELNRKLLELTSKRQGAELQVVAFATGPRRWSADMPGMGTSELKVQIRSAVAALYVHFALEIVGKPGADRDCRECGTPIIGGRRNKVFCSTECQQRAGYRRRRYGGGS